MKKWMAYMLLIATLLIGSVIGFNLFKQQKIKEYLAALPIPTFPVTAQEIKPVDWIPNIQAIGFIEPNQGVTVANEVAGKVVSIQFKSGQTVKAGQPLVSLDSKVEQANLRSAQGKMPAVSANYKRMQTLYQEKSVSRGQLDDAQADYLSLQAEIESYQATIDRRNITVPFDGVVGLRNVYLGQYMQAGDDIVRLEDISLMRIRLTIPQTELSRVYVGQPIEIYVDAEPEKPFYGSVSAIEPAVQYQSGVIQVQANIPNTENKLRAGMFAKVRMILPTQEQQVIVPETAINYTLYGETVYVIKNTENEKAEKVLTAVQTIIKLGESKDGDIHILSGLNMGDKIVTSGQIRLSNHAQVKIVESDVLDKPETLPAL